MCVCILRIDLCTIDNGETGLVEARPERLIVGQFRSDRSRVDEPRVNVERNNKRKENEEDEPVDDGQRVEALLTLRQSRAARLTELLERVLSFLRLGSVGRRRRLGDRSSNPDSRRRTARRRTGLGGTARKKCLRRFRRG